MSADTLTGNTSLTAGAYRRVMSGLPIRTPRAQRHRVLLSAVAERFGKAEESRHRVRNLSASGGCIDRAGEFSKGLVAGRSF